MNNSKMHIIKGKKLKKFKNLKKEEKENIEYDKKKIDKSKKKI